MPRHRNDALELAALYALAQEVEQHPKSVAALLELEPAQKLSALAFIGDRGVDSSQPGQWYQRSRARSAEKGPTLRARLVAAGADARDDQF